jgi:protoporphyrinogen/coproporphyrinogen III oxidase
MRRVAILGAGISGLAAALRLRERFEVTVYDAMNRAGGCIDTVRENGFTLELGPDSVLIDKPAGKALLERLQLSDAIVDVLPQYKGARIVHNGSLRRIPPDFRLFTPTSLAALLGSGIFSPLGIARAAMEPFIPPRRSQDDESLGSFVTRRFGREVLDRLAQPLIGGIYSADPYRLSMEATLPQFLQLERTHGSLVRAMRAAKEQRLAPRLVGLRFGLGSIVSATARELGDAIRLNAYARDLRREGERWLLTFADGTQTQADAIICALPAHASATLLRGIDEQLAEMLASIRYNSIATVNIAYEANAVPQLPPATGFVVPNCEGHQITAATIVTQKYADRAPANAVLLRAFIGGALQPALLEYDDDRLVGMAREEFTRLLGIRAEPLFARVQRWERLLPEYGVGHAGLVRVIEERAAALPELSLAGSAFQGVGIPDCIQSGERAADRLVLGIMKGA